jgi:hypothetical protein
MKLFKAVFLFLGLLVMGASHALGFSGEADSEKQMNQLLPHMVRGIGGCWGAIVSPKVFLTAAHCKRSFANGFYLPSSASNTQNSGKRFQATLFFDSLSRERLKEVEKHICFTKKAPEPKTENEKIRRDTDHRLTCYHNGNDIAAYRVQGDFIFPKESILEMAHLEPGSPVIVPLSSWRWDSDEEMKRLPRKLVAQERQTIFGKAFFLACASDDPFAMCLPIPGDSGSPIFVRDGNEWKLAGLVSGIVLDAPSVQDDQSLVEWYQFFSDWMKQMKFNGASKKQKDAFTGRYPVVTAPALITEDLVQVLGKIHK